MESFKILSKELNLVGRARRKVQAYVHSKAMTTFVTHHQKETHYFI
jgi:hypothetical protein